MAYPTDPPQVGLTVAKNTLAVVDTVTQYTTNQTITNTFFQRQVYVRDGATVTFTNCWFVPNQTTYSFGDVALRIGVDSSATVTNCEFGISAADAQTYLGGDGSWIEAYGTQVAVECPGAYVGAGVEIDSCYFHHTVDFVRPQGGWTITSCYMADIAINLDIGLHADCIQFNRGVAASTVALIEDCYIRANLHPDTLFDSETTYANRAVFVKPDEDDIDGTITVNRCYLDSEGFYPASTSSDEIYGYGVSAVVHWSNNVIGRSATVDAITDQSPGTWVSTFENNTMEPVVSSTYENKSTATASNAPVVVTIPATAETGDVCLVGVRITTNSAGTWTVPTDAVELQVQASTAGSGMTVGAWSYVVKDTDTPGTTTLSFAYSVATNLRATLVQYTGNHPTSPVAASAKAFDGSTFDTNWPAPAVTTTADGQTVVTFYAARSNTTVSTHSPAATEREDATDANGVLAVYDYVKTTAGDTGAHSVTAGAAAFSAGITVALADAPAPAASSGQSSMTAGGALRDDLATILY